MLFHYSLSSNTLAVFFLPFVLFLHTVSDTLSQICFTCLCFAFQKIFGIFEEIHVSTEWNSYLNTSHLYSGHILSAFL